MIKRSSLFARVLSPVIVGLALMHAGTADAACRQVGDSWLTGDCSPGSSSCEKHLVVGYGYYGNDTTPLLTVARYRRTSRQWYFVHLYSIRC